MSRPCSWGRAFYPFVPPQIRRMPCPGKPCHVLIFCSNWEVCMTLYDYGIWISIIYIIRLCVIFSLIWFNMTMMLFVLYFNFFREVYASISTPVSFHSSRRSLLRYRKENTGSMNEEDLRRVEREMARVKDLEKRWGWNGWWFQGAKQKICIYALHIFIYTKNISKLGGGNSTIFLFHPDLFGNDPIWRAYF